MADAKKALGRYPSVCYNAHESRHENGNNALHGKKRTDMSGHSSIGEVDTHACKVCAPYSELQEIHEC